MKKIVLTGGPCAGKTTVLNVLKQEFAGQILVIPEAATLLLSGGFPTTITRFAGMARNLPRSNLSPPDSTRTSLRIRGC